MLQIRRELLSDPNKSTTRSAKCEGVCVSDVCSESEWSKRQTVSSFPEEPAAPQMPEWLNEGIFKHNESFNCESLIVALVVCLGV